MTEEITKEEIIEREKKNKEQRKIENKQLKIILIIMASVVIIALLTYYISYTSKNFTYKGIKFTKIKQGSLEFWNTKIPIRSPTTGEIVEYYDMTLRNDPRTLEYIKTPEVIKYGVNKVYLSFQKDMESCEDNLIGVANFARFASFAGINLKGASTDDNYANETGIPYVTCENADVTQGNTAIIMQNASLGGPTIIRKTINDCYVIDVNNCEMVQALERLMVITATGANNPRIN